MKVRLGAEGEMVLGSACRGLGDDRWHFHDIRLSSFLHFLSHPISDEQCTANVLQIAVPSYNLSLKCLGEIQSEGHRVLKVRMLCWGIHKGARTEGELGALAGVAADEIAACRAQRAQRAGQHLVQRSLHLALQPVGDHSNRQR